MTQHGNGRFRDERIGLKHGAGGVAMRLLIEEVLAAGVGGEVDGVGLAAMDDGAAIRIGDRWLVITTDSHVVSPLFFPGGDIGRLAVSGTVNDLAMMGATEPLGLTSAFIIEEGFPRADLERVMASMRETCREANVSVLTGDTKVMGHGELDRLAINTTGVALTDRIVTDAGLRPGDRLLVTGTMGDHGLAILATRNELALETALTSDVAPVHTLVRCALEVGGEDVVAMKDPTRGGLSSALHEMAGKARLGVVLEEAAVPIREEVRAVAELLGIDPLQVANEGKVVMAVRPDRAEAVLDAVRGHPLGREAALVGTCVDDHHGRVVLDTGFGARLLTELESDPLPRIC